MTEIKSYYGLDLRFGSKDRLDWSDLSNTGGYCDGRFFAVVKCSGGDAMSFLNGQTSQKVSELAAGEGHASSFNTPKGKTIALIDIFRDQSDFYLVFAAHACSAVISTLDMYLFAEDVALESIDFSESILVLGDRDCAIIRTKLGLPTEAKFGLQKVDESLIFMGKLGKIPYLLMHNAMLETDLALMSINDFDALRMLNLYPIPGVEYGEDRILTPELDQSDRIHYQKGCFVGQEVFARLRTYGRTNKTLATIALNNCTSEPHTLLDLPVSIDGKSKGNVCSAVKSGSNVLVTAFVPTALKAIGDEVELGTLVGQIVA